MLSLTKKASKTTFTFTQIQIKSHYAKANKLPITKLLSTPTSLFSLKLHFFTTPISLIITLKKIQNFNTHLAKNDYNNINVAEIYVYHSAKETHQKQGIYYKVC